MTARTNSHLTSAQIKAAEKLLKDLGVKKTPKTFRLAIRTFDSGYRAALSARPRAAA
jgi:hypothetical protein